jgi:alpha-tubulin suppressor-like RCC1 family protein
MICRLLTCLHISGLQIAAGWEHSLAVTSDGNLYTWGSNQAGQLGDTTVVARSSPVQVGTDTYNFNIKYFFNNKFDFSFC